MKAGNEVLFTKRASAWFKGLAIIMVILSHYAQWWSWFYTEEGITEKIRVAISGLGPYGVAIFLLFSGYGLVKSVGEKRVGVRFVVKRLCGVYIPYLILVGLMEILSGGFETPEDVIDVLFGNDFWYMTVLFSFYIAFILFGLFFTNRHIRAALNVIFAVVYSYWLYCKGEQDFWYISNFAFAIGVILALYEAFIKNVMNKAGIAFTVLLGIVSGYGLRNALFSEHAWENPEQELWCHITTVLIFTLFIVCLTAVWKWYEPILVFLGKYSLYLYLTHTFVFMWAINHFEYEMSTRFVIATLLIIVIALPLGILITKGMEVLYSQLDGCMRKI